jgi:hypothetical protein
MGSINYFLIDFTGFIGFTLDIFLDCFFDDFLTGFFDDFLADPFLEYFLLLSSDIIIALI